jgi:hypothetical protein
MYGGLNRFAATRSGNSNHSGRIPGNPKIPLDLLLILFEMFSEYKAQVLLTYQKLRNSDSLNPNLARSTPSKLRAECLVVFSERYKKGDEITIKTFFGAHQDEAAYVRAIEKFDADKFRPLDNFIKGRNRDPEAKNIELLAWLINYEPRPYRFNPNPTPLPREEQYILTVKESIEPIEESATEVPKEMEPYAVELIREKEIIEPTVFNKQFAANAEVAKPSTTLKFKLKSIRNPSILIIAIIASITGAYLIWSKITDKCMYWTGERYVSSSCNIKIENTAVIALDTLKLNHFKRITRPDTITYGALKRVWYFKANNSCEFFTGNGFHPIHTERRLKPLTKTIIDNYILVK